MNKRINAESDKLSYRTVHRFRKLITALFCSLIVVYFVSVESVAGTIVSLDSLLSEHINTALNNNPALTAASIMIDAAREGVTQAATWKDPSLKFSLMNMPVSSFDFNQEAMTGVSVGVAQMIPWKGKTGLKTDISGIMVGIKAAQLFSKELDLAESLSHIWFDLAFLTENLNILSHHIMLIDNLTVIALSRYETGSGLQQDILRAETMRSKHEDMRIELEQNISTLKHRFASLMGGEIRFNLTTPSHLSIAFSDIESNKLTDLMFEHNPEWNIAQLRIESAQQKMKLAELAAMPDFNFGAGYTIRQDSDAGMRRYDLVSLSVGATLPVHKEKKQNAAVREMAAGKRSAMLQKRSLALELNFRLQKLFDEDQRLGEQIMLYTVGVVPQAEATLAAATSAYSVGKADFQAPLSADLMLHDIQLERLVRIRERLKTRASLSALTGGMDLIGTLEPSVDNNGGYGK